MKKDTMASPDPHLLLQLDMESCIAVDGDRYRICLPRNLASFSAGLSRIRYHKKQSALRTLNEWVTARLRNVEINQKKELADAKLVAMNERRQSVADIGEASEMLSSKRKLLSDGFTPTQLFKSLGLPSHVIGENVYWEEARVSAFRRYLNRSDRLGRTLTMDVSSLKRCGWTEEAIVSILGPPPVIIKNPRYACSAPSRRWYLEQIADAMKTPKFQAYSSLRKKSRGRTIEDRTIEAIGAIKLPPNYTPPAVTSTINMFTKIDQANRLPESLPNTRQDQSP